MKAISTVRSSQSGRAAISEPFTSGGCNDGFLRDDAVLVVVLISDDMDEITDGPDEVMEGVGELRVPLRIDVGVGKTLADAKS